MVIYKATNTITGHIYIGQTTLTLEERKHRHELESMNANRKSVKFHNALLKYGFNNFTWEVIYTCNSQEELDYWETYYIDLYHSCDRNIGYNLKSGGRTGGLLTEEAKINLGKSTKRKWQNKETALKMREGLRKGTETMKRRALLNFTEHTCPVCQTIFRTKNWNTHTYCSLKCANIANKHRLKGNSDKAAKLIKAKYSVTKEKRYELVQKWAFSHISLISNAKLNNLNFLRELALYIGVRDTCSLGKVLDVRYKKDILLQLKAIIKCTPNLQETVRTIG